ncbi:MAG: hypothetical protein Q9160_009253, partial [Pyrenula sp. 1 TL-2023]
MFNGDRDLERQCSEQIKRELERHFPEEMRFGDLEQRQCLSDFCVKFVENHQHTIFARHDFGDKKTLKETRQAIRLVVIRFQQKRRDRLPRQAQIDTSSINNPMNSATGNVLTPAVKPSIVAETLTTPPVRLSPATRNTLPPPSQPSIEARALMTPPSHIDLESYGRNSQSTRTPATANTLLPLIKPSTEARALMTPPAHINLESYIQNCQSTRTPSTGIIILSPIQSLVTARASMNLPVQLNPPVQKNSSIQKNPPVQTTPPVQINPSAQINRGGYFQSSQSTAAPSTQKCRELDDNPWGQKILEHNILWKGESHNHNWLLSTFMPVENRTKISSRTVNEQVFAKWVNKVLSCCGISMYFLRNRVSGVDGNGTKVAIWDFADWVTHIHRCHERQTEHIQFLIDLHDR